MNFPSLIFSIESMLKDVLTVIGSVVESKLIQALADPATESSSDLSESKTKLVLLANKRFSCLV